MPPPQPKTVDYISRDNPIHVGDWVHPNRTGMDHFGTDSRGKCGYLGGRAAIVSLEGGGGGDLHPD